jgi:hypothetical protein
VVQGVAHLPKAGPYKTWQAIQLGKVFYFPFQWGETSPLALFDSKHSPETSCIPRLLSGWSNPKVPSYISARNKKGEKSEKWVKYAPETPLYLYPLGEPASEMKKRILCCR